MEYFLYLLESVVAASSESVYDWTVFLSLLAFIVATLAEIVLRRTCRHYENMINENGLTGAQAAEKVLEYYMIQDVPIKKIHGYLSDHYDPREKTIFLSDFIYESKSIAAIGIACHEAGHAAQHSVKYFPNKVRNFFDPFCYAGSVLGLPVALFGLFVGQMGMVWMGLGLFSFIAVFQVMTLPIEINASRRALYVIETAGLLDENEKNGAEKVLMASALTYVASLVTALLNLIRYIILFLLASVGIKRD